MSLPPAFTGSAPSERMSSPRGPLKSEALARNVGRRPSAGLNQPPMKGGSALLDVVGRDDERAVVGQVVEAFDTDTRDGAQADAAERGHEARIGRQGDASASCAGCPAGLTRRARAARMTRTTSSIVPSNARSSEWMITASSGTRKRRDRAAAVEVVAPAQVVEDGLGLRGLRVRGPRSAARRRARSSRLTSR